LTFQLAEVLFSFKALKLPLLFLLALTASFRLFYKFSILRLEFAFSRVASHSFHILHIFAEWLIAEWFYYVLLSIF
jgi:hypothetical protein